MQTSRVTIFVFLVVLLFTSFLLVELFWGFVTPIVLALVLTSIFHPFYRWTLRACRGYKHIAAFLVLLVIILGVSIPLFMFVTALSKQAFYFYQTTQSSGFFNNFLSTFNDKHPYIQQVQGFADSLGLQISAEKILASATELVSSFSHVLYNMLSELPSNALSMVFNSMITLLLVYSFFVTGSGLKSYLMEVSPLPEDDEERILKQFTEITKAVFVGNGLVSICEGILGGFAFYYFDLGPGLFWGVVISLASFLPIVSANIVVVPATIYLWLQGDPTTALIYFGLNSLYLIILELIVKPRLIGGKSKTNTVLVLLSVLGGIQMFGILGVFYGPLVVTMFLTLIEMYKDHYKEQLNVAKKGTL